MDTGGIGATRQPVCTRFKTDRATARHAPGVHYNPDTSALRWILHRAAALSQPCAADGIRNRGSPRLLARRTLQIRRTQKLLNLVLKYHWCLGQISEPPHCPIDRIIIQKIHLRGRVNWTEIVDEDQYRAVIEAVRRKAEPESITRRELRNYRRRSSLLRLN